MGKLEHGAFGGFSGKVGNVVGSKWRGGHILRSRPVKSKKPLSVAQLAQRHRMRLASMLLTPAKMVVNEYFGEPQQKQSRMNLATAYHMKAAVAGIYPELFIDYAKVLFTLGYLLNVPQPSVALLNGNRLLFQWTDNSGMGNSRPSDQLLVMAFNESLQLFEYNNSAVRSNTAVEMQLLQSWEGTVHCWIGLWSENDQTAATSVYLGTVVLV